MSASGGTPPLKWDVPNNFLPQGFFLSQDGTLNGTWPAYFGGANASISVRVTDSANPPNTATQALTLDIFGFRPTTIPTPQVGVDYFQSAFFASDGGIAPITWQVTGELPNGLTFVQNPATTDTREYVILGTPLQVGSFQFSVTARDSGSPARSETISYAVEVEPAVLKLPHVMIPPGVVGQNYDFTFSPVGGAAPFVWTITPTGPLNVALPPGMQFDAVNGKLTGKPTAPGYGSFVLSLADSSMPVQQHVQQAYWFLVTPTALPPRNDTIATATPIFFPGTYNGSISPYGDPPGTTAPDQDYYQLTAPAGTTLSIGLGAEDNFRPLGLSTLDPVIEIVDANGQRFMTCNDPFNDNPPAGIPIAQDTTPNGFDDPCMNHGGDGTDPVASARLGFRVPGNSGNITFYLHVFDFRGDARQDMFYIFSIQ
jgi:hypothetical protein